MLDELGLELSGLFDEVGEGIRASIQFYAVGFVKELGQEVMILTIDGSTEPIRDGSIQMFIEEGLGIEVDVVVVDAVGFEVFRMNVAMQCPAFDKFAKRLGGLFSDVHEEEVVKFLDIPFLPEAVDVGVFGIVIQDIRRHSYQSR